MHINKPTNSTIVEGLYLATHKNIGVSYNRDLQKVEVRNMYSYLYMRDSLFQHTAFLDSPIPIDTIVKRMETGEHIQQVYGRYYIKSDTLLCIGWNLFEFSSLNNYDYYHIDNSQTITLKRWASSRTIEGKFIDNEYASLLDSTIVIHDKRRVKDWPVKVIKDPQKPTWLRNLLHEPFLFIGIGLIVYSLVK